MSNRYKIGEFSKYMGVTPDFLKHYEQFGLIQPSEIKSGYRYYDFEKASETIECIKLKNWGFSVKEIRSIVQDANLEEIMTNYQSKIDEMQNTIHFYQAVIDEYNQFKHFIESAKEQNSWTIEYLEPTVFLPHSNNRDFMPDPHLYEIMEQWVKYLPIVHSCQRIYNCFDENKEAYYHWGYSISKKTADQLGLIQTKPCELIERRKCLIYRHSIGSKVDVGGQIGIINGINPIIDQYHLKPLGEICRILYQYSHESGNLCQHSIFIIPLK